MTVLGGAPHIALGDFGGLEVTWTDSRTLRPLADIGHVAGVTPVLDVEIMRWLQARTEYHVDTAPAFSRQTERFPVVSGDTYEGAIIPASSPWHGFFKTGLTVLTGRRADGAGLAAWTPAADDVAAAERHVTTLVELAAREPATVASLVHEGMRRGTTQQLPWLAANVRSLKRQYYGIVDGSAKRLLIHGFQPRDDRWRSESLMILDGGCGNVWFDVSLSRNRIAQFVCGGLASPSPAALHR